MRISYIFCCIIILALTACGDAIDNDKIRVDVVSENVDGFDVGQLPLTYSSAELRSATAQGLVKFDARGNITPALASRWIVTDDGLSYIFRIEKTWWKNGEAVTAETVARILRRKIRGLRKAVFLDEMESIEEVVAMTGRIIEIRLAAPRPNLLELLAQPELGIVNDGFGSGPMQAFEQSNLMRLRHIIYDENGQIKEDDNWVTVQNDRTPDALARYIIEETDLVLGGRFDDLPYFAASGIDEELLLFDPVPGLFGFLFVEDSDYLASAEIRNAITMAIDRPRLLIDFRSDWREVLTLVPEGLQNRATVERPEWTSLRIDERIILAKTLIANWKETSGDMRELRIALPNGPGSDIIFARLKTDLAKIGVRSRRVAMADDADLRMIDQIAPLSSPLWYLSQLSCKKTVVCDEEADDMVSSARLMGNLEERQNLLAAAERRMQENRNFIPIAYPTLWMVARPGLLGFSTNPRGLHPLQSLGKEPI